MVVRLQSVSQIESAQIIREKTSPECLNSLYAFINTARLADVVQGPLDHRERVSRWGALARVLMGAKRIPLKT
jgi:hypothetical protein